MIRQDPQFGPMIRELRLAREWSLRDLAQKMTYHHGYVGKVEQGIRFPDRQFAERASQALDAPLAILSAWEDENDQRLNAASLGKILTASVTDSLALLDVLHEDGADVEVLADKSRQLAVDFLRLTAEEGLIQAVELRSELLRRLRLRDFRHHHLPDLYMALGWVQGVLSYASLDLNDPAGALSHTEGAWVCAEKAGSNDLKAWTRGTQSLILRFDKQFAQAEKIAIDGLRHPGSGTGELRLLSAVAQCRANLGDGGAAVTTLDRARRERDSFSGSDQAHGLFTFSEAKQHYYTASSLMWLPGRAELERAAAAALIAVSMWQKEPPATRSLDDEMLAHIYAATANVKLGHIAEAADDLAPVLALPPERRISWIVKRLRGVADILDTIGGQEPGELSATLRVVSG